MSCGEEKICGKEEASRIEGDVQGGCKKERCRAVESCGELWRAVANGRARELWQEGEEESRNQRWIEILRM